MFHAEKESPSPSVDIKYLDHPQEKLALLKSTWTAWEGIEIDKILAQKKVTGKDSIVTIYFDEFGKIKGKIWEDGVLKDAFFVKDMSSYIDVTDQQKIALLRLSLHYDCYFYTMGDDIFVNGRILGGGFGSLLLSGAQIVGGVTTIATTGFTGVGLAAGGALIGSGFNGLKYSWQTKDEDFSTGEYLKDSAIGAAAGCGAGVAAYGVVETAKPVVTKAADIANTIKDYFIATSRTQESKEPDKSESSNPPQTTSATDDAVDTDTTEEDKSRKKESLQTEGQERLPESARFFKEPKPEHLAPYAKSYFADHPENIEKLFQKLDLCDSDESFLGYSILDYTEGGTSPEIIAKQKAHIKEEQGHELIAPEIIKGLGQVKIKAVHNLKGVASVKEAILRLLDKKTADAIGKNAVVELEGTAAHSACSVKLYSLCHQLCETKDVHDEDILKSTIETLVDTAKFTYQSAVIYSKIRKKVYPKYKIPLDAPRTADPRIRNLAQLEIVSELEKSSTINELAKQVTEAVSCLKDGKRYLLGSGCCDHSMCHIFEKKDGKIYFSVHNGGFGADKYQMKVSDNSGFYAPKSQISEENMSTLVKNILVYKEAPPERSFPKIYSADQQKSPSQCSNQHITPQQKVGNCAWHNLDDAVSTILGGRESDLYKKSKEHELLICDRLKIEQQGTDFDEHIESKRQESEQPKKYDPYFEHGIAKPVIS